MTSLLFQLGRNFLGLSQRRLWPVKSRGVNKVVNSSRLVLGCQGGFLGRLENITRHTTCIHTCDPKSREKEVRRFMLNSLMPGTFQI